MKNSMTIITKSMWIMALSLFLMNTAFAQSNVIKDVKTLSGMEYVVEGADRGNKLGLLIELPGGEKPGNYYFFRIERIKKNAEMSVITSDKALQAYILELKEDKLKDKDFSFELKSKNAAAYLSAFRTFWGE